MKFLKERKDIANQIASKLPVKNESDKKHILELLQKLGYENEKQEESVDEDYFPEGNIGIYKPEIKDGETYYHRDQEYMDRWTYFADVPTIPPKSHKKRIVYLGESAARGFLLDPDYTPCIVLDKLLNANGSKDEFEVIDLAETNLTLDGISHRFKQCIALEPDMVIMLAGNNWIFDFVNLVASDKATMDMVVEAVEKCDKIGEIKPVLEGVLENIIKDFIAMVDEMS
ncbi:MAG: hypothetical protein WBA74_27215, partial [Cyclobacteriaceae bacterium]